MENVSKTFAGTTVLSDISASLERGKITALLGHNGSGKSTLVKILAGFHAPDPGAAITLRGESLQLPVNPRVAHESGLRFVHQNLALVEDLTVADNIALAQGFENSARNPTVSRRKHRKQARQTLSRLEMHVEPDSRVGDLTATERMLVAIARAIDVGGARGGSVVVLDEPTAYLPPDSVQQIHGLLESIRSEGGSVLYVTHRLDEVVAIADSMLVLRDGRLVVNREVEGLDEEQIAKLIVGKTQKRSVVRRQSAGSELLLKCDDMRGPMLQGVSIEVSKGQILGVAGLIGCGRSELLRLIGGIQSPASGDMQLAGKAYSPRSPRDALDHGVAYVPPDRARSGVIDSFSLRENMTVGDLSPYRKHGHFSYREERADVTRLAEKFNILPPRGEQSIEEFSGGNQQKAVLAKLMRLNPFLLALDEPTQGVDIGGKREIAELLVEFAQAGNAVIVGSSDFDEIAEVCDKVLVLDRGSTRALLEPSDVDEQRVALLAARNRP